MNRWVMTSAVVGCGTLLMLSGCATTPASSTAGSGVRHMRGLTEPVAFSDEGNRDLVRQTRELIALKGQDYLIGADDVLEISIFEWEMSDQTKTLDFRVSETGIISLPSIGILPVSGKAIADVQVEIEREFANRNILINPRVGVRIKEFRSRRISVIGAVNAPGVYAIHQNVSTLLEMLTLAGGPNDAAGGVAHILRYLGDDAEPVRMTVDIEGLLHEGRMDLNPVLQAGDVVHVPRSPLVYVYGKVRQPGGFAFKRSLRSVEAMALAGGFDRHADRGRVRLIRRTATGGEQVVVLNFSEIEQGRALNPYLREGDVIYVPSSEGKILLSELWSVFRGIFTFTYRLDSQ